MQRDLNVKFYVGKADEASTLKNAGDFFRDEDTGDISVIKPDGSPQKLKNSTYKVYSALISQSGTDAPTAIVLENTLGVVPTFARNAEGNYSCDTVTPFDYDKFVVIGGAASESVVFDVSAYDGDQEFFFATSTDGRLNNYFIEIRVYE